MALETRSAARQKADAEVLDRIRHTDLFIEMTPAQQTHYTAIGHAIATASSAHLNAMLAEGTHLPADAWRHLVDYSSHVLQTDWQHFWANAEAMTKACQALGEVEGRNAADEVEAWTGAAKVEEGEGDDGAEGRAAEVEGTLAAEREIARMVAAIRTIREGIRRQLSRVVDALVTLSGMLEV